MGWNLDHLPFMKIELLATPENRYQAGNHYENPLYGEEGIVAPPSGRNW